MAFLDRISWPIVLILCATIGLSPYFPEPHLWEKLKMLFAGTLAAPIDIFDLAMHGAPFALLLAKAARDLRKKA